MRPIDWKVFFQERNLLQALIQQPSGRMPRERALQLLQGDAARLDGLVHMGILLRQASEVLAGPPLLWMRQAQAISQLPLLWQGWQNLWHRIHLLASDMDVTINPAARERLGTALYPMIADLRTWTLATELAFIDHFQGPTALLDAGEVIPHEMLGAAAQLQQWTLRQAAHPAWEQEQQALINDLNESAERLLRRLREVNAPNAQRRQKLDAIQRLSPDELLDRSNLTALISEGTFLSLHAQLGIVVQVPLNTEEIFQPLSPSEIAGTHPSQAAPDLSQLMEAWRGSNHDLFSFLLHTPPMDAWPDARRMDLFRSILQERGDAIRWENSADRRIWEVWPKEST